MVECLNTTLMKFGILPVKAQALSANWLEQKNKVNCSFQGIRSGLT